MKALFIFSMLLVIRMVRVRKEKSLVLSLSSDTSPRILDSTTLNIWLRFSGLFAAATHADQSEEAAAVLMKEFYSRVRSYIIHHLTALAVLPACHLREGATMSVTTDRRHEENVPDSYD